MKPFEETFMSFNSTMDKLRTDYLELAQKLADVNFKLGNKSHEEGPAQNDQNATDYLDSILESINAAVLVVDLEGKITLFNKKAEEITGYSSDEALNSKYLDLFGDSLDYKDTPLYTLVSDHLAVGQEKLIVTKTGESLPVEFSTSLVTDNNGKILGAVEILRDIAVLRNLEQRIQKARTLAVLGEMAALIAHEIRNPLCGIGGFASLLERDLGRDDPRNKMARKIIQGVSSLEGIIHNLLVFTSPLEPKKEKLDIASTVESALLSVQTETEEALQQFEIIRDFPQKAIYVEADPELMLQALSNLFKNAFHAMPKGGRLNVEVESHSDGHQDFASVKISDTGPGILHKDRDQIFSPFFTTKQKGTGLGLAIVEKILRSHDGSVEVESKPGVGATLVVTLPCYA